VGRAQHHRPIRHLASGGWGTTRGRFRPSCGRSGREAFEPWRGWLELRVRSTRLHPRAPNACAELPLTRAPTSGASSKTRERALRERLEATPRGSTRDDEDRGSSVLLLTEYSARRVTRAADASSSGSSQTSWARTASRHRRSVLHRGSRADGGGVGDSESRPGLSPSRGRRERWVDHQRWRLDAELAENLTELVARAHSGAETPSG